MPLDSIADALSGLQANQEYMNVIGNNIANVNTVGYKTQSIHFEELLNQTLAYGSAANGTLEGTNPLQLGMGTDTGAINLINTQGSVQDTGRLTDMAIQGNGYFVVGNGQQNYYTRDGSFNIMPDGTLASGDTGMSVMGWSALNPDGSINTTGPVTAIKIPLSSGNASATTQLSLSGNLDATQATYSAGPPATGGQFQTSITVYDSQGAAHQLSVTFQKTGANAWSYTIAPPTGATDVTVSGGGSGTLSFDANGQLQSSSSTPQLQLTFADNASNANIKVDMSTITQLAASSQVNVANEDGTAGGKISTFSVNKNGIITAVYSNGNTRAIGQLALADFRNPDGLMRMGNNLYATSINSGSPQFGQAGIDLGTISTGQLEGSNVDLAAQFAQMIQAQQGFNANAKVVTTSDQMLQSVIGIIP